MWTAQGRTALTTCYLPRQMRMSLTALLRSIIFWLSYLLSHNPNTKPLFVSWALMFLHDLGYLSQMLVKYIRGKHLSRSLIFVREGGRVWCCYLSGPAVERLTGWDKNRWDKEKACRVRRGKREETRDSSREEVSAAEHLYSTGRQ